MLPGVGTNGLVLVLHLLGDELYLSVSANIDFH